MDSFLGISFQFLILVEILSKTFVRLSYEAVKNKKQYFNIFLNKFLKINIIIIINIISSI
jgi:hypothetical protein